MEDVRQQFRSAMAHYPSGVVIVTTIDSAGSPQGFTATSFSSLSMEPPSVLVCLANSAFCYEAFVTSRHFAINFVDAGQDALALRFASRGADKFGGVAMRRTASGAPVLEAAAAYLECESDGHFLSGDHAILIGNVLAAGVESERDVLVHYQRRFGRVQFPSEQAQAQERRVG